MSEPKPIYAIAGYVEVRGATGKLLFRYDPVRNLVQIKLPGQRIETVDLQQFQATSELIFLSLEGDDIDT